MHIIEKQIRSSINVIDMKVIDESANHTEHYFASHTSLPSHVKLIIISNDFLGMSSLKRHRLVYSLLKNEIKLLHAISLRLYTQSEIA